jgi:hypothetical protein
MTITAEELLNDEARQGNREMTWRPEFQNPRNINNVENPQPN